MSTQLSDTLKSEVRNCFENSKTHLPCACIYLSGKNIPNMPQTGATRHQKFLKSEKSKTKLKAKKKDLPKGTNVTKTNFKVKKIVIKEQLKKHGKNEALSSKKLNLKELLSRLNHFNTKSRTEALDGIKEIISTHADVLDQNLGQIILGVTPLVLNVEKVVSVLK